MLNPLVSILIPVYNRENIVAETIESAMAQTYKNIEIIIVDNCSTDNTWQVLKDYAEKDSRIRIFKNAENIGPVKNWKRCIDEAKGEYAKILFSDDLIADNYIEETLKIFDNETAFVLTPIFIFGNNKKNKINHYKKNIFTTKNYLDNALLVNYHSFPVSPGAALFRTKDLKNALEIEIENPLGMDFSKYGAGNDLLLFLNTALNYKFVKTSNITHALFRHHNDSFTVSNKLNDYYNFSKYYFIKNHLPEYLNEFKTVMWVNLKRKIINKNIYNLINARINFLYIIRSGVLKLTSKLKLLNISN